MLFLLLLSYLHIALADVVAVVIFTHIALADFVVVVIFTHVALADVLLSRQVETQAWRVLCAFSLPLISLLFERHLR